MRRRLALAGMEVLVGLALIVQPLVSAAQEAPVPGYDALALTGFMVASAGGGVPNFDPIPNNCGNNVCWVGGTGNFNFNSALCQDVSDGEVAASTAALPEVGTCSVTSTGTFTNIVCGTGVVQGSATTTEITDLLPGGDEPDSATDNYTSAFAGMVGVLIVTSGSETDSAGAIVVGAGVVDLTNTALDLPQPSLPLGGPCAPTFTVAAAAVTTS